MLSHCPFHERRPGQLLFRLNVGGVFLFLPHIDAQADTVRWVIRRMDRIDGRCVELFCRLTPIDMTRCSERLL